MVFRDLMEGDKVGASFNIMDSLTGLEEKVNAAEFLNFWTQALCTQEWSKNQRLLAAFDIPSSQTGLGRCELQASPYQSDSNTSFNPKAKWKKAFTTSLTPPGAITSTHMDHAGCSQYMIHLTGRKLWLFWPPTEKNLDYFGSFLNQPTSHRFIIDCIHKLEGLQLHYIDDECSAFVLPPNYLHAVISIGVSAHAGILFCDAAHFSQSATIMNWLLKWAKNCGHYGHTSEDARKFVRLVLDDGVGCWEKLCKHSSEAQRLKLADDVQEIKKQCVDLLKYL
jgi:hypothetical protein